ncbi:hypothetical protein ACFX1Q_022538 [Malus domestica]
MCESWLEKATTWLVVGLFGAVVAGWAKSSSAWGELMRAQGCRVGLGKGQVEEMDLGFDPCKKGRERKNLGRQPFFLPFGS